jgi:hypothetical protein
MLRPVEPDMALVLQVLPTHFASDGARRDGRCGHYQATLPLSPLVAIICARRVAQTS